VQVQIPETNLFELNEEQIQDMQQNFDQPLSNKHATAF
jgi:hypothetical protein